MNRSTVGPSRSPNAGTGAWIPAIGRPSFSASLQCEGKHNTAADSS